MVGPAMDCFSNPLGAVRFLFDKACVTASIPPSDFCKSDWGVRELFRKCVLDSGAILQVPEVNSVPLDSIPVNSLVRFRGMIQDMFNVEYYVGAFKDGATWRTNKYTDIATVPIISESEMQVWDRRPLYCVPVPGENSWVKDAFSIPRVQGPTLQTMNLDTHPEKRPREACSSSDEMEDVGIDTASEFDRGESKRVRAVGNLSSLDGTTVSQCKPFLNMPLGEDKLVPCLLKVYDGADSDLKLNDVVEFIGVLTFDPEVSIAQEQFRNSFNAVGPALFEDEISAQLPASKVPRLHCILYRKLSGQALFSAMPMLTVEQLSPSVLGGMRSSLLQFLIKVLGGDDLAAQYLLLHLLSQVHTRVEPMAVGKLSLNLTGFDAGSDGSSSAFTKAIAEAIAVLLPRSHLMPLSLESLNKAVIAPRKNYNIDRLVTGALQLADGTHLTLDETVLNAGELTSIGVQNVQTIKNLMEWQKVEYDFQYYKIEMPTDVPVLVLSCARSRLFSADTVVPLRFSAIPLRFLDNLTDAGRWRVYLSLAKSMPHTIEPSMQKIVEGELVAARQRNRSLGPEVFHRWLTMARLLSISFGESTLSLERWNMVRDLERRCAERLR
eukprot:c12897_g1_i1 orf=82-1905(+)